MARSAREPCAGHFSGRARRSCAEKSHSCCFSAHVADSFADSHSCTCSTRRRPETNDETQTTHGWNRYLYIGVINGVNVCNESIDGWFVKC